MKNAILTHAVECKSLIQYNNPVRFSNGYTRQAAETVYQNAVDRFERCKRILNQRYGMRVS